MRGSSACDGARKGWHAIATKQKQDREISEYLTAVSLLMVLQPALRETGLFGGVLLFMSIYESKSVKTDYIFVIDSIAYVFGTRLVGRIAHYID